MIDVQTATPLPGNAPLSLRGAAGKAWLVASGAVDLFSTGYKEGRSEGARMHIMRVEAGHLFVAPALEAWPEQIDVLAVGTVDARVAEVERGPLGQRPELVTAWADGISALARRGGADVGLTPLHETLSAAGEWGTALDAVHAQSLQHVGFARLDRRHAEEQRLMARAGADDERFQLALTRLARVLSPGAEEAGVAEERAEDVLVGTCRLVLERLSIELPKSDEPVRLPTSAAEAKGPVLADPVAHLARGWRLRVRMVMLRDDWFRHDSGPLLGFLEDGRPVALLPVSPRQYEMVDLVRNKKKRIDEDVAAGLRPQAYTFYRPLPDHPLGVADLMRFSLFGTKRDLAVVLATLFFGGMLGTIVPIVTGILIGTVIPGADRPQLFQLVMGLLWTSIAMAVFSLVQSVAMNRVEQNMEAPLQAAVWDRLLNLPVTFFRRYNAGDLASRAMGVSTLRRALTGASISSILGLVMSLFNLCLLFYYDTRLAFAAIGLLVVQMAAFAVSLRLQIKRQRRVSEVQGRLSGLLLQLFTGISKLRVAGVEDRAFGVWASQFAAQSELTYDARRVGTAMATFDALFAIGSSMIVYAIVAFGGVQLSTGAFLAFTAAFGTFLAAFMSMNNAIVSVIAAIPAYERSQPILQATPEVEEARARVPVLKGEVDLSHVLFRYRTVVEGERGEEEQAGPLILNDVSIRAKPGQFVAIVGPSGSGKSTIFRLLLGFEQPDAGSIYYDGESLNHLDVQAVRSQIGVVLQNGRLMSGDIFRNIVGARALTEEDAWRAAEMAGIADEIRAMPMGMHTVVSEGAGNLSGGQRQRLLIARAIVGNPRVLLFDEATSALDNYTQAKVSEALRRLPATRIVIAHRLSTVQDADCIYVLKDARVVESGSFEELMAAHGAFYDLVQRQLA